MNTANLQLEGLVLAIAEINRTLVEKRLLSADEIDVALAKADAIIENDRAASLSSANHDAARFPIRVLRIANRTEPNEELPAFSDLAKAIGAADQLAW